MASIFKKRITRYVDQDGKRVNKRTPGARKKSEKSRKWYGEYKDSDDIRRCVPLSSDKDVALAMLNEIVRNVERRKVGLFDPFEEHGHRLLLQHVDDYQRFLQAKGDSEQHVAQTISRIRRLADGCGFQRLRDIDATKIAVWLADQRMTAKRFSAQTSNFYLDSFKFFCNWLTTNDRMPKNPLASLQRVNIATDRRHDRRSLSDEEYQRLICAAEAGPRVEGVNGSDRAMLYILATWTGYRRRELASLTLRSIDFNGEPPTVNVRAAYSKRRREDAIPLHPYVVDRLSRWLAGKRKLGANEAIFSLKTRKGHFRKTSKMMRMDLERARQQWLEEAQTEDERARRRASDFLRYCDEDGLFADFHANRHTFISNLSRAGVPLVIAQKLARHSDPRLTANRYTHLEMTDKAEAITSLPAPAELPDLGRASVPGDQPAGTDESLVAGMVAGIPGVPCPQAASNGTDQATERSEGTCRNPRNDMTLGNECHQESSPVAVHPRGLEPLTFGSVDRCRGGAIHNELEGYGERDEARCSLWCSPICRDLHRFCGGAAVCCRPSASISKNRWTNTVAD